MLDLVALRSLTHAAVLANFALFDIFHLTIVFADLVEPGGGSVMVPRVQVSHLSSFLLLIRALFGSKFVQELILLLLTQEIEFVF